MKLFFLLLASIFFTQNAQALSNYAEVYPPIIQTLEQTGTFYGDRHGDFIGNDMLVLYDGSVWKVHPDSTSVFRTWQRGDVVHISARTDWYWFKREHKFMLYNHTRSESIKVMLIQHQSSPVKIVSTDVYYKSYEPTYVVHTIYITDSDGNSTAQTYTEFTGYKPTGPRKILILSDGSIWVIKDKFNEFQLGTNIYIGAQGVPGKFYDFVLIVGNEREAIWTLARPQK